MLPSRLLWELDHDPDRLILQVVRVRGYQRAMQLVAQAKTEADLPETPIISDVIDTRLALMTDIYHQKLAEAAERKRRTSHGA